MASAPPRYPSYDTATRMATRPLRERARDTVQAVRTVGPRRILRGALESAPTGVEMLGEAGATIAKKLPILAPLGVAAQTGIDVGRALRKVGDPTKVGLVGLGAEALGAAQESLIEQSQPAALQTQAALFGLPTMDVQAGERARAAAKKVSPSQATSAAAAQPPPKTPGAAVGPETLKTEMAGEDAPVKKSTYYDRVKAVKMPGGKIVFTNVPGEYTAKGAEYQDYGAAVEKVSGRPWKGGADVYEGPEGTAYVQPGQEWKVAGAFPKQTPDLESALPPLSDPQDILERRDWLARKASIEAAQRQEQVGVTKAEAEAAQAVAAAQMDPATRARLEAEAKYGGDIVKAESEAARTELAIKMINRLTAEMNRIRQTMPPGPERDQHIRDLEEQRKLYLIAVRPEAASGLMRPDPFAAFAPQPAPIASAPAAAK